jgi:hypothetical protein
MGLIPHLFFVLGGDNMNVYSWVEDILGREVSSKDIAIIINEICRKEDDIPATFINFLKKINLTRDSLIQLDMDLLLDRDLLFTMMENERFLIIAYTNYRVLNCSDKTYELIHERFKDFLQGIITSVIKFDMDINSDFEMSMYVEHAVRCTAWYIKGALRYGYLADARVKRCIADEISHVVIDNDINVDKISGILYTVDYNQIQQMIDEIIGD